MRYLRRTFLPLVILLTLPLHEGHGQELLRQRAPRFVLHIFSKYEHIIMRTIDYLASAAWIHDHAFTKRLVDTISKGVIKSINGEILNLEESRQLIEGIASGGYTIAVGTCPCRRARNEISDTVPNNTDMVFGRWAEEYLENYPGLYSRISREEALGLVESFDRHGFIHQIYGFPVRERASYVLCNCDKEVCIPLQAHRERGYPAFRKGRSLAAVDTGACVGVDECGACIARCPFGARAARGGTATVKSDSCYGCGVCVITCRGQATRLERKPDAQLIFARNLVD
jgi:NAD-dependent dihydropyrimidine dehydrogenase PreA subunit